MKEKELILIDLSSIFWQAWHATADQEIGSAFKSTLHKIQKYVNGDNVIAICVDKPPYKRKDIDPNYKANRSKAPPLAVEQLRRVIEHLENDGFPVLGSDGYEADDIIATIVDTMHKRDETPCMSIISSDKDLSQLLAPGIKQTSPMTGETLDINSAVEKFCVMPSEIGDLLALMGDKSDNVPGVYGIGPKTAVTLLKTHGWDTLIELIDLNDPDGKLAPAGVRQKLLDNFDNLKKSRELVRLMTDAPIDVDSIFKPRVRKVTEVEKINDEQFPEVVETATADNRFYRQKEATSTPSTAIVKSDKWALRLEPTDSESAFHMCKHLFNSRLYTKFPNQESIFAIIMRGRELGMGATTALAGFHVIQGQPTMSADLIVALVLNSGKCDYFKLIESTDETATYKTHRKGDPDPDPTIITWTIDKARKMQLASKDNWKKQPDTMLRHRAAAALAREVYPDITLGIYTPDEISNGEYIDVEAEIVEQ